MSDVPKHLTCATCPAWNAPGRYPTPTEFGECRFNPPSLEPQLDHEIAQWPITQPGDWCMKHPGRYPPISRVQPL